MLAALALLTAVKRILEAIEVAEGVQSFLGKTVRFGRKVIELFTGNSDIEPAEKAAKKKQALAAKASKK